MTISVIGTTMVRRRLRESNEGFVECIGKPTPFSGVLVSAPSEESAPRQGWIFRVFASPQRVLGECSQDQGPRLHIRAVNQLLIVLSACYLSVISLLSLLSRCHLSTNQSCIYISSDAVNLKSGPLIKSRSCRSRRSHRFAGG